MLKKRDQILAKIHSVWDKIHGKIPIQNYCVDFAVQPDCSQCWIVEVNAFLPPLAGSGLFQMHVAADRDIIYNGPFTFRFWF